MKRHLLLFFLLLGLTLTTFTQKAISIENKIDVKTLSAEKKVTQPEVDKYAGYQIDGFATASKLAAQRSHTPAGEDERNFAVFTGLVVIIIVGFFSTFIFGKNYD
jgi:hypothetical protein